MTLQSELNALTLADLLACHNLADLYSVQEDKYPYLRFLSKGGRHAIKAGWEAPKREKFESAALALRALILVAQERPYPKLLWFLTTATKECDLVSSPRELERLKRAGAPTLPVLPIVKQAQQVLQLTPRVRLDDLDRFILKGVIAFFPLLTFLTDRAAGQVNSEAANLCT